MVKSRICFLRVAARVASSEIVDEVEGVVKSEERGEDLSGVMTSSRSEMMKGWEEVSLILDGGSLVFDGGSLRL